MATNLVRKFDDAPALVAVCSNPSTPASGSPVRIGKLTGVAINDEGDGGNSSTETSVDIGVKVWDLLVDDNGGSGIAVGDAIYYHDTATGSPTSNLNNSATSADAFFGIALEAVAANATTTINVLHINGLA